jgi:glycosyltransferase involved in cell wall biosynthesis
VAGSPGGAGIPWPPFEVIFVDDGSGDRSSVIVRGFHKADHRVRLLRLKTHAGRTSAIDAGLKAARGRWVVVMDADRRTIRTTSRGYCSIWKGGMP